MQGEFNALYEQSKFNMRWRIITDFYDFCGWQKSGEIVAVLVVAPKSDF